MNRKSHLLTSILFFCICIHVKAQILNIPQVFQEQNLWCWSAVSSCTLDYYGNPVTQCEIAEYTRTVATWHDFGPVNCCTNPSLGCNYWNYNWGYPGSIQDILVHFASIQNNGISNYLDQGTITNEIVNNRPFIIRWAWTSVVGGHFLVGHGLVNNDLYYMDPWVGEGLKISDYSWVVSSSEHNWTHTNQLVTSSPRPYPGTVVSGPQSLNKGQQQVNYTTQPIPNATSYIWEVHPSNAGNISSNTTIAYLDLSPDFLGSLEITVKGYNEIGEGSVSNPLTVNVVPGIGITEQKALDHLSIYPNPSTGKITLQYAQIPPKAEIDISTITGMVRFNQLLPESGELDLSFLPKGVYLIKITSGDYSIIKKLILQ